MLNVDQTIVHWLSFISNWFSCLTSHIAGCFSKDQVYLDGILKILKHREKINFPLLMALGKVRQCI